MVNCLKSSSCSESPFLSECANSYGASCEVSDVPSVEHLLPNAGVPFSRVCRACSVAAAVDFLGCRLLWPFVPECCFEMRKFTFC
jgi:hypothetical protein